MNRHSIALVKVGGIAHASPPEEPNDQAHWTFGRSAEEPTTTWGRSQRLLTPVRAESKGCRAVNGPLIVQSDKTLLLEVGHELADECRRVIAPFAELERAPEHIHTYRVTPLGLWNARAAGHDAEQVVDALVQYSRYPVPHALLVDVAETMDRYGRLTLSKHPVHGLVLTTTDRPVLEEILRSKRVALLVGTRIDPDTVAVHPPSAGRSSRPC